MTHPTDTRSTPTMNHQELVKIREHYDTTSTAEDMKDGIWDPEVDPDPMVTTSLRLPKSLLDWVREQAGVEHTKPTALIRRWIEQRRDDDSLAAGATARIERLEQAVFHKAG